MKGAENVWHAYLGVEPLEPRVGEDTRWGAELLFRGVVRGSEKGRPIRAIDYTAYEPMALQLLRDIVGKGAAQPGIGQVSIQHRLGEVAAGQPSLLIQVWAVHSAEGFETMRWCLNEVKQTVPIWKRIVY